MRWEEAMGNLVGQNLGPYRILEQVGAGGMATVYKAYHAAMDRYVAIKVLPEHLARDPNFHARFQREARTIARLEHRSILPVHDAGEDNGVPYMVMRYTNSGDLGALIARGQLTVERAVVLIGQVADALAYAHRQGVIHRDVKPGNVLISSDGDALLTDFGIAKIYEDNLQLTSEGALVGTPAYMAPEQIQGKPVDARTDIYALGVVLYQALTGEVPFVAETPLAVALMHVHNPLRPPRELNPHIPDSLERVMLRAMAKDPADRFQTADEMAAALRSALAELRSQPPLAPPAADPRAVTQLPAAPRPAPQLPAAPTPAPQPAARLQPAATIVLGRPVSRSWLIAGALGVGVAAVALILALVLPMLNQGGAGVATLPTGGPSGAATAPAASVTSITALPVATAAGGPSGAATAPSGATTAPSASVTSVAALPVGPTVTPRANLRVFGEASDTYNLAALGDTVWASTNGGLVRYGADGKSRAFTAADGLPSNYGRAVVAAPDGTLWRGGYASVTHIRPVVDGLGEVTVYGEDQGVNISDVYTLMVDRDSSIWLGGEYGLRRFDGSKWAPPDLPLNDPVVGELRNVVSLLRSSDGALWVGLAEGLLRWDGQRWTRFGDDQGIGKAMILRLLQDRAGTIWAAAGGAGLLRFDAGQDRWQKVMVSHEGEDVRSIVQLADGRLWVSNDADIAQLAEGGTTWETVKPPDQYPGWAGSGVMAEDAAGRVWISAGAGVSALADGQWRLAERPSELPMDQVGKLGTTADGKLWAIQQYGGPIATIDPQTLQVAPFTDLDAKIYAVSYTKDAVWFGTDQGLVRKRGGATLRLTTADGLPSDAVYELLATDTTLWIGTDKGLTSYDLASDTVAKAVSELDGGIIAVLLAAPDGAIWAGSLKIGDQGRVALGRYDGTAWQIWSEGDPPLPQGSGGVIALSVDAQEHVWVAVWSGGVHTWDGATWKDWAAADGAPEGNVQALAFYKEELWLAGAEGDLYGNLYRWNKDGWSKHKVDGLSGFVNGMRFTDDGALWLATNDGLLRLSPEGVAELR
jgi:ligand-binding sensor domain-containing protein/tRNA A-37 threonylcarbamoyl transferase component Bud32